MTDWQVIEGDCIQVMRGLPAKSVHCVVTSPPYFGLRDYNVEGQIGLEPTPADFIAAMVAVFSEVWRVLRDDGTVWLNIGDSYAGSGKGPTGINGKGPTGINGIGQHENRQGFHSPAVTIPNGMKPKDLMMMPARVAIALQDAGWYLRSDIIWCKRAPMPESVTDRPTSAHEHIFLLTKSAKYFYDGDAIREQSSGDSGWSKQRANGVNTWDYGRAGYEQARIGGMSGKETMVDGSRNAWNYWVLSPEPYAAAHFATFPTEIPRRAIAAGTSQHGACGECGAPYRRVVERTNESNWQERTRNGAIGGSATNGHNTTHGAGMTHDLPSRDTRTTGWQAQCTHNAPIVPCTVLDPFSGAGTTVMQALRMGRRGIGIELSPAYCELSMRRIVNDSPLFNTLEAIA